MFLPVGDSAGSAGGGSCLLSQKLGKKTFHLPVSLFTTQRRPELGLRGFGDIVPSSLGPSVHGAAGHPLPTLWNTNRPGHFVSKMPEFTVSVVVFSLIVNIKSKGLETKLIQV